MTKHKCNKREQAAAVRKLLKKNDLWSGHICHHPAVTTDNKMLVTNGITFLALAEPVDGIEALKLDENNHCELGKFPVCTIENQLKSKKDKDQEPYKATITREKIDKAIKEFKALPKNERSLKGHPYVILDEINMGLAAENLKIIMNALMIPDDMELDCYKCTDKRFTNVLNRYYFATAKSKYGEAIIMGALNAK